MKEKKRLHQLRLYAILFVLAVALTLVLPQILRRISNEYRLFTFSQQLFSYPLPPETTELSREAWIDLGADGMSGSMWCDYAARRTIITNLSAEELTDYYNDVNVRAIDADSNLPVHVYYPDPRDNKVELVIYHSYAEFVDFPDACDRFPWNASSGG